LEKIQEIRHKQRLPSFGFGDLLIWLGIALMIIWIIAKIAGY